MKGYKEYKVGKYFVREWDNGDKYWHNKKTLHREDGPAVELNSGKKGWYMNGELHREDGPAIKHPSGYKVWCLEGKYYLEEDHKIEMRKRKMKEIEL